MTTIKNKNEWILAWSDEFDGANGSLPDPARWRFDTGGHGWGNNELQTYTARRENACVQNGHLVIQTIQESYTGTDGIACKYTSARLNTRDYFSQTFGRFEARIKVPDGKGLWPAFWLLGIDIATVGWPQCGEIDIMEILGKRPSTLHGTVHGPGFSGSQGVSGKHELADNRRYAHDFHVYAVEWERDVIRYFVDEVNYFTIDLASLPDRGGKFFQGPFFILLNVAVGGNWPGPPDAETVFPQTMLIDYVRVYRRRD